MKTYLTLICCLLPLAFVVSSSARANTSYIKTEKNPSDGKTGFSIPPTKSKVSSTGPIQKKVYKINGTVRNATGNPISDAKFVLPPLHKPHGMEFMSEPDGTFKISYTSDDVERQDLNLRPHDPQKIWGLCKYL